MIADEQEWKELLSKIGFLLCSGNFDATDKMFFLVTKTGNRIGLTNDIWEAKWQFFSILQLEKAILQDDTRFVMFDDHGKLMYYNNPWQSCRSLEELKIKTETYIVEMTAFTDHLTKDMVNDLLKSLTIHTYVDYIPHDHYYILAISDFQLLYGHKPDLGFKYIESYSLDGLLEQLFACDVLGGSPNGHWKTIDNPYYGCKSLEEAMIKKDLTYGN